MCTLTLKFSWGITSSDWANVCNQDKPFSTNVYQRMLLKRRTVTPPAAYELGGGQPPVLALSKAATTARATDTSSLHYRLADAQ